MESLGRRDTQWELATEEPRGGFVEGFMVDEIPNGNWRLILGLSSSSMASRSTRYPMGIGDSTRAKIPKTIPSRRDTQWEWKREEVTTLPEEGIGRRDTQWEWKQFLMASTSFFVLSFVGEIPNGMLGVVEGGGHLNFSCEASHRDFRGDR